MLLAAAGGYGLSTLQTKGAGAEAPGVAQIFMGPGRHLVSYPLGGGLRKLELFNRRESLADGDVRLNGSWDFWGFEAAGAGEIEVAHG